MPHLILDHSANLEARADIPALCASLHEAMRNCGLFELGAIRVRALRAENYAVADLLPENAYLHLTLRIGAGRSLDDRKRAGEAIFQAACTALAPLFATPHFALTLEMVEIDPDLSWKKNVIHPRLRGA